MRSRLTDREWEVLDLLSTGATTDQIARNLGLSAETVRSPSAPEIVSSAPSATISGGRWFVGSFEQTLPPIVPRLRTSGSAISGSARSSR